MRVAGLPTILNPVLSSQNTEVTVTLPANYKKFTIQARQNVALKLSYRVTESGTNYITIKAGSSYFEDGLRSNNKIFIQSATAGTIVEIVVWSGGDDNA